ncbi:MAG TPA: PDDEXK nuclease domain-containing protein [Chthonomonadaceae bacterium]|nr:PDDEXK nuclease domain-containing protein [Chthonomonadaceae bacterium]
MSDETQIPDRIAETPTPSMTPLLAELRQIVQSARERVATTVNAELTMLYWRIGERLRKEILQAARAEYGKHVVDTIAISLTADFGNGFGRRNLFRMIQFAEQFPEEEIVSTLSAQLSWSHILEILLVKDRLARKFYVEMCRLERWSVRTLRDKINGMLFERTALSKKPEELIRQELDALTEADSLTPDMVFRDPYLLSFLGLLDTFSEKELSDAILREIERFLLERGRYFTFVARKQRIVVDGEDHEIDLLLYHRALRRLVVVELKIGKLQAAHKGQTELYLSWLNQNERLPSEEEPLGLILCTEAGPEQIALLSLHEGSIRVAEYLTILPSREVLQRELFEAIRRGREQIARRTLPSSIPEPSSVEAEIRNE